MGSIETKIKFWGEMAPLMARVLGAKTQIRIDPESMTVDIYTATNVVLIRGTPEGIKVDARNFETGRGGILDNPTKAYVNSSSVTLSTTEGECLSVDRKGAIVTVRGKIE